MRPQSQIEISAQVWVCNGCGGQDHKSCSCNSTARMEELAAKREASRQRMRRMRDGEREKANENNGYVTRNATIENIEEISTRAKAAAESLSAGIIAAVDAGLMAHSSSFASEPVEFAQKFTSRLSEWLENNPRLPEEAVTELSNALFLCSEEYERLARHIQNKGI